MATFTTTKTTITLTSKTGTEKDRLLVASWARNLMAKCEAKLLTEGQAYSLSAGHLEEVYMPKTLTLEVCSYYMMDMAFWAKLCKK